MINPKEVVKWTWHVDETEFVPGSVVGVGLGLGREQGKQMEPICFSLIASPDYPLLWLS